MRSFRSVLGKHWKKIAFSLIVLLVFYSVIIEPRWVAQRNIEVSLPISSPLKVAVASDWHFTKNPLWRVMTVERARAIVADINAAKPDVILLPGDLIADRDYKPTLAATAEDEIALVLGELRAPLGVYVVLGNHDWWHEPNNIGKNGKDVKHNMTDSGGAAFQRALEARGMVVLSNKAQPLGATGLWVAGIDDHSTDHANSLGVRHQIPEGTNVLMMMHDPAAMMDLPKTEGLIVAGHMHGGQVSLPWIGALLTPGAAPRTWAYGWVEPSELSRGNRAYVTSGLGVSILPIRFNMRPEWVLFDVKPVAKKL
jgi:uncharacterized protein